MTDSMKERAAKVADEYKHKIKDPHDWFIAVDIAAMIRALPDDAGDMGELVKGLAEIKEMHCDGAIENHDVIDEYRDWSTKAANTITALQAKVERLEKALLTIFAGEQPLGKTASDFARKTLVNAEGENKNES